MELTQQANSANAPQRVKHSALVCLQVKNFNTTTLFSKSFKPCFKTENKGLYTHEKALQALSNGHVVAYEDTLRVVRNDGNRGPRLPPRVTQKPPGYIRNETGGTFTS